MKTRTFIFLLLLGLSTLFFSCDGGNGGTTGPTTTLNIAGTWDITFTVTETSGCGTEVKVGDSWSRTNEITQTGNNITIVGSDPPMTGTIEGNQVTLEGSDSNTKVTFKGTVSADGKSMTGTGERIPIGSGCYWKASFTATKR